MVFALASATALLCIFAGLFLALGGAAWQDLSMEEMDQRFRYCLVFAGAALTVGGTTPAFGWVSGIIGRGGGGAD